MQFWAANDTASSEGYSGDNGIRSWEMQPLQMKNKKRSDGTRKFLQGNFRCPP